MTQTALQKTNNVTVLAQQFEYEESFVQTVKDTFAKGATDNELKLFLQTAKRTGLDPFARQIFCVKRWDSSVGERGGNVMSVQISIDGFRAIADRTGKYVPSREPSYNFNQDGGLESATAYIKKFGGGVFHEIAATAFYSEYVQLKKDGTPNSMWNKMPRLMLAKCAESLVLRKAFPAELSGLYTSEEMGSDTTEIAQIPVPDSLPKQIDARKVIEFSPEEISLRQQLDELYRSLGYTDLTMVFERFDALRTLDEKEDAVATIRAKVEAKEKESLVAWVSAILAEKDWEEGELDQFFIDREIDDGLNNLSVEKLRVVHAELTTPINTV